MNLSMEFILAVLGRQTALLAAMEQELMRAQERIAELEKQGAGVNRGEG